ncbi:MAG: DUF2336 domain-containing protein [Alphaproteobacteria bacterium]|nr:DUF2336 domain-containing protein [Alphaproteobacteria bacterium]MBF0250153.1 DUF2336 domain-containing protein [Alphaproteobacteria bacterium]
MMETVQQEKLLSLAKDASPQSRNELATVIEDLFENRSEVLSDREKRLMFNIIEKLIHEVEITVRKRLSANLATQPDAPLELINELARDEIEVAYPILTKSNVLRDTDLIEIIRLRTEEYHLAITLRDDITEDVSDALIEAGSEDVIESLLRNENARISEAAIEYLVDQSKRVDTFQEPLLHRKELKEELAQKMFMWVSSALRDFIVDRYEMDEATVNILLEQAAQDEIHTAQTAAPVDGAKHLIKEMRHVGMVTPRVMVQTLARGEIPLFISMFAELLGIPNMMAKRIVLDEAGKALALGCKAAGVSDQEFAIIFANTRKVAPKRAQPSAHMQSNMTLAYRKLDAAKASQAVLQWAAGNSDLGSVDRYWPND